MYLLATWHRAAVANMPRALRQAEAMPDLINLRIFSNVLFFIGRSLAGEDTIEAFTKRAQMYAGVCPASRRDFFDEKSLRRQFYTTGSLYDPGNLNGN
jgi:hypothetical protein